MLTITLTSGASREELIAANCAISALLYPDAVRHNHPLAGSVSDNETLTSPSNPPIAGSVSDNEPEGRDADGKPKRFRRTKAQIEADRLAEAARLAGTSAPAPAAVSAPAPAASTTPAPVAAPAPATNAAAALFGDAFPPVAAPDENPATLGDLMALVNDLLAVDSAKGMAGCVQIASEFGVASFKQLDTSKFGEARAKLRALLASLKAGAQ